LVGISKRFGSVQANQGIDLDIYPGRIHALLGENGAGKSTLMSILAGRLQPDSGLIVVDGQKRFFKSTADAIAAGIGMVYQHFTLVDQLDVTENILLGQEQGVWLNRRKMIRRVHALAERYGLQVDPERKIFRLSMGERQRVEILKLLHRQSRVLILDEPTAVLTPDETQQLFVALRQMTRQGKAIVFISHKLTEVMQVSDGVAILRRGRIIDQVPTAEIRSRRELARRMVGRDVVLDVSREPVEPRQRVLRVEGLSSERLSDIQLSVRQGEIVSIVGVAGNGQQPLVETICGLLEPREGRVTILGLPWHRFFQGPPIEGLSYIPEDRQGLATCRELHLIDNFLLTTRRLFSRGVWLRRSGAVQQTKDLIDQFAITPPLPKVLARQLSGGNLQKMVLAREFFRRPRLIVAEQPTQGLDIQATEEVWKLLLNARRKAGILIVTGDLAEARALSDRIAVIFDGRLVDTFSANDPAKLDMIGSMMAGLTIGGNDAKRASN
jgi:ABC-type uncharacterized transport system ATPase subunit